MKRYDSHREAILLGQECMDSTPSHLTSAESLLAYFSKRPLNNDPHGFYATFQSLFQQLASEEEDAIREDPEALMTEFDPFPLFQSPSGEFPLLFYTRWSGFASVKSFRWMDTHNLAQAQDRHVRRKMEKENKKERQKARLEFNQTVRNLVLFIKKRDPRYHAYLKQQEALAQERRAESLKKLELEKQARQEIFENFEEADWSRVDEEGLLAEYEEEETIECIVCDVVYRTLKQLQNHEKTRKHALALEALKESFEKDGDLLSLGSDASDLDPIIDANISEEQPDQEDNESSESPVWVSDPHEIQMETLAQTTESLTLKSPKSKKSKTLLKNTCQSCQTQFQSRNALFDHLRTTGHASLLVQKTKKSRR